MNTSTKLRLILFVTALCFACSSDPDPDPDPASANKVTVTVSDSNGQVLKLYALQVIDPNDGWLGTPFKSVTGGDDDQAALYIPGDMPVILRIAAPGHHPKFTILMPGFDNIDIEVSLKSLPIPEEPSPLAVGNFNHFDFRSGVEMETDSDGVWKAVIETELDTIRYFVRFNSLVAGPGTNGRLVINDDSRGISEAFLSEIVRNESETTVEIEFDASRYNFGAGDSDFKITSDSPDHIIGIAGVYTLMTDESINQLLGTISYMLRGETVRYKHDFEPYLSELGQLETSFSHPQVSIAADLARFRFHRETGRSKEDAIAFLDKIEADSPLWMIHFTALTDAVDLAGLNDYTGLLESIAANSSFESLRGEAQYNLIRYHHQEENAELWYAAFFDLVSNYPDHFRTMYAYERYAPEQPIAEGKALPYNEFNALEGEGSMDLNDIEESYLLVDFWATWCGPCIAEMPKLHELHEQYKDSDFAIVSISVDEDPNRVHSFRNEWEMPWYHGHQKQSSREIREMGIAGVPYYILLGPDRTVVSNDQSILRGQEFPDFLDSFLNRN